MIEVDRGRIKKNREVKPNDPMFLITNPSMDPPYDKEPYFTLYEKVIEEIQFGKKKSKIEITYSHAKDAARLMVNGEKAGNTRNGKRAEENKGISIVRAGRN